MQPPPVVRQRLAFYGAFLLLAVVNDAAAQQLFARHYGVADGLVQGRIAALHQDARGYLWIGTWDGLSRFDGQRFTNYRRAEGLPSSLIAAIVEDRRGRLWMATHGGGLARLIDDAKAEGPLPTKFRVHTIVPGERGANQVWGLLAAPDGGLWCVAQEDLYRGTESPTGEWSFVHVLHENLWGGAAIDGRGRPWFGSVTGAVLTVVGGRVMRHPVPRDLGASEIRNVWEASDGRLWVIRADGVLELAPAQDSTPASAAWRRLPITSASPFTGAVARDAAGTIWLGTTRGLVCVRSGVVSAVNLTRGATRIDVLVADREENLWIGTEAGLFRLPPERVAWFPSGQQTFGPVVEGSDGRIYVSADHGILELTSGTSAAVPGSTAQPFRRLRNFMCDSRGDWWIGTAGGLYRFRGPRLQFRDGRRFGPEDGLPRTGIVDAGSLHEDAQGLVWVSCAEGVYRYDPSRRRPPFFERVPMPDAAPTIAIGHDPSGVVWLTSYNRTLRVVGDRLSEVHSAPGLPATELADVQARAFLEDSRGWFWIGLRHDGVSVTREPRVAEPRFVNYSSRNGLGSDVVWSVAEDAYGRMYFATSSGLVRFDVSASRFEQLTAADGLPADTFYSCLRDRRGDVWAGAWNGVARLSPLSPGAIAISPAVYLQRLRIAGEDVRLPERGTLVVPPLTLAPGRNNALIEYGGVRLGGGGPLRYRYRLEGADNDWGAPVSETAVSYARLAPGSYRFLVRAVAPDGRESPEAASVAFRILPPLWRRGWFMALTALATILAATAVQRLRIARAVAMERVRRQIATDLHDDVGSGLAQIAVLSEVARRDAPSGVGDRMAAVAGLARTLRESMGDIVWAVDPRRDRLTDVVRRMRQTAFDLAEADGIRVDFALPDEGEIESLVLPPDHKRQVYLVFKESMTNVVRHAGARNVRVTLEAGRSLLTLTIEDDGSGFDSEASHAGLGIASLRRRAEQLRGRLEILSAPGRGVKVRLEVPLGGWLRRRGGDDRA